MQVPGWTSFCLQNELNLLWHLIDTIGTKTLIMCQENIPHTIKPTPPVLGLLKQCRMGSWPNCRRSRDSFSNLLLSCGKPVWFAVLSWVSPVCFSAVAHLGYSRFYVLRDTLLQISVVASFYLSYCCLTISLNLVIDLWPQASTRHFSAHKTATHWLFPIFWTINRSDGCAWKSQ